MTKKVMSVFLATFLVLTMFSTAALAANRDVYDTTTGNVYEYSDFMTDDALLQQVLNELDERREDFVIEFDGKGYNYEQLLNNVIENDNDLEAGLEATEEVEIPGLVVTSVSAITQTIPASEETELTFMVNGEEELTAAEFAEKYGEEGYTVEFKYNFSGATSDERAGIVNKDADFKYAVEVTDAEGNVIPEGGVTAADFVDVKVVNAADAVKVNSVALYDESGEEWTAATVAAGDNVTIAAKEWENAFGETNNDEDVTITEPTVEKITSSDPAVAFYDNGIQVLKAGEVTFTVKFTDIEETVTITVNVKEQQEVAGIEADSSTAKVVTGADVKFMLLDQDGEKMRNAADVYYTATLAGEAEDETASIVTSDGNGVVTITAGTEAGVYTVNVYKDGEKKDKLGSFTYEAVDIEGEIDAFEIVIPEDAKFEIVLGESGIEKNTVEITINGYIDGVKADAEKVKAALADNGAEFTVEVADEKVATADFKAGDRSVIEVTPVAAGTTTIKLVKAEGDLVTTLDSVEITVENKVPQITELNFKEGYDKVIVRDDGAEAAVVEAMVGNEDVDLDGKIESAVYAKADGVIIVKLSSDFGGKEFTVSAEDEVISTYGFDFAIPDEIVAGEDVTIDVTFAATEVGNTGYEGVRFAFSTDTDTVTFTATDSEGNPIEQILSAGDKGYWGPAEGFSVPADYEATTEWTLNFSTIGDYTITFSLVDAGTEEVIDEITENVTVTVVNGE